MLHVAICETSYGFMTLYLRRPNTPTIVETLHIWQLDIRYIRYNHETRKLDIGISSYHFEMVADLSMYLTIQNTMGLNSPLLTPDKDSDQ